MLLSNKSGTSEIHGVFELPSSKSISNRLLILKALCNKDFEIQNLSESDDTKLLNKLLAKIQFTNPSKMPITLDTDNAGTVMRFLCAFLSIKEGNWILTGSPRMKKRPIEPLVKSLNELGADIEYMEKKGFPPLAIKGGVLQGKRIQIRSDISSQYISALLLIGTFLKNGLEITLNGSVCSTPYIEMTISLMRQFGADIITRDQKILLRKKELQPSELKVEADWSAASYWFEMVALSTQANILLKGLKRNSIQGDSILTNVFEKLGVQSEFTSEGLQLKKRKLLIKNFEFDFSDYPDIAPAVIITCAALEIESKFSGLENLTFKESNRFTGLIRILKGLGMFVETINNSTINIVPCINTEMKKEFWVHAEGDHRMAMCSAPLGYKFENVHIIDSETVTKSYPKFWDHIREIGLEIYS